MQQTHKQFAITCLSILFSFTLSFSQVTIDTSKIQEADTLAFILKKNEQAFHLKDGTVLIYPKPKQFGFITNFPNDAVGMVKTSFKKENIKPLLFTTGATLALLIADQKVHERVQQFSKDIHFHIEGNYNDLVSIKLGKTDVRLIRVPGNLSTGLYQLGQGFPGIFIGAGLFAYGKINNNYRALSTASQLAETFILMGVTTQVIKRITGRQSPSESTTSGGAWQFFPAFKDYQANTPKYDAFPSGHIATMMSTITVLAENYPEKKYIKPVGYSLMGLVSLTMISKTVHWISDYPLAIALGYVCAKQVVMKNRKVIAANSSKKNKGSLSYTFNYQFGQLIPGVVYKF